MIYIDLPLKHNTSKDQETYLLSDAINKYKIIVLLGPPGSGKSTLLEKYQKENVDISQKISVKKFIKLDNSIKDTISVLLLDGLDEYRTTENDKSFVMTKIGNKINELFKERNDLKVVISCREMDWYGEYDKNALKEEIEYEAELFSILSVSVEIQDEFVSKLAIKEKDIFLEKFRDKGFLDNPQMFKMIAEIWENDKSEILSKIELYRKFILNSREKNETHKRSQKNIEIDDLFRVIGYLGFFYIFCAIDEFDDELIDKIANSEENYSLDLIKNIMTLSLFSEKKFLHRTIAEFSLANFIVNDKLTNEDKLSEERIKSLFIKKNKIPTELRGTYAWLCSISANQKFIKFDPYYQAIHGDNSLFQINDKENIIEAVREYSESNPYFFEFGQKMELDGFYVQQLDDCLISEFDKAIEMDNHYVYFLANIIAQGNNQSEKIKTFIKIKIENPNIRSYYKVDLIKVFEEDYTYLKKILDLIKDEKIKDNSDTLKEHLLRILYPRYITNKEVVKYLTLYKSDVGGYCYYLFETNYEDKKELVDKIYEECFDKDREPKLLLPKNVDSFIHSYFLETILKFEELFSAKEIYDILIHYKKYYNWYEPLQMESYWYDITDKEKVSQEKLQRLSNELYSIYLDDVIVKRDDELYSIYSFDYIFNYKVPTNKSETIFSKISDSLDKNINLELFISGLNYLERDENNLPIIDDSIRNLAKTFSFEKELNDRLKPIEHEWQKRRRESEEKKNLEELEVKQKNEDYFNKMTDEEIQASFNALNWFASLLYIPDSKNNKLTKYLEEATIERLTKILKNLIFTNCLVEKDLLTIDTLAKDSPNAHRNIDTVYYVSLCLNKGEKVNINDINLKKYLYINVLHHNSINIIPSDFLDGIEESEPEFIIKLLKEYIGVLVKENFEELHKLICKYIENEQNINYLKTIAKSHSSNLNDIKNSILENVLSIYGFQIEENELYQLLKIDILNELNKNSIEALYTFMKNDINNFSIVMSISLHNLIRDNYKDLYKIFKEFNSSSKVKIIHYMLNTFNTEESIKHNNGFQSSKDSCAEFLRNYAFILLNEDELIQLYKLHDKNDDIWKNRILHKLNEVQRNDIDKLDGTYNINSIKDFIFNNSILSNDDFFTEVYLRLINLKQKIEDDRNNDKLSFYNTDTKKAKLEDECRDLIVQRLEDGTENYFVITREHYEANNRADINIKYKNNPSFEVQIECKKDIHPNLFKAIPEQLISKYLSSKVQYGIYLVFYFGDKEKNRKNMIENIEKSVPSKYDNNIKIVVIDLSKENT